MNILFFDTCNNTCSVALFCDGQIYSHISEVSNTQSASLIPSIQNLFSKSNINFSQLDYVIVTNGPGSFTGVRVGLSVALGFKIYSNLKILTINSLVFTYLAYLSSNFYKGKILVMNEAPKNEVYYQYFEDLQPLSNEPRIGSIESLLDKATDTMIIGNSESELPLLFKNYINVNKMNLELFIQFCLQNGILDNEKVFSRNLYPFYLQNAQIY